MKKQAEFDRILERTHTSVRAYIAGLGVPFHAVDDVAQEVYVEYYNHMERQPEDVEAIRWLKGIAKRKCFTYFREQKREETHRRKTINALLAQHEQQDDVGAFDGSVLDALARCLRKLTKRNRELLTMRYEERRSYRSIAGSAGGSEDAARITLYRLRNALRKCVRKVQALES